MEETKTNETEVVVETTNEETKVEKTFTQEEVNELLGKEKSRLKKGMPSKEELDEYNKWKDSQKTELEKQQEIQNELNNEKTNNKMLKQENIMLRKGVNKEDIDYIQFKVNKMEGDFEENLDIYLQENPKFTQKETKATGVQTKVSNVEKESGVNAILKAKYPNLFN